MFTTRFTSHLALAAALSATGIGSAVAQTAPAEPASPQPAAAAPAQLDAAKTQGSDIIVTGLRTTGVAASESPAPIKLIGEEALTHVGQPSLSQALNQLVPSFNAQQYSNATAGALTASLRGLSPNQTLILVNGKRRHGTAVFQLLASGFQGSVAPDLDLIPKGAIKRIEVLEDGAAAQYGSDAIAGVVNIILNDKQKGGSFSGTAGQYYKGDGLQYAASLDLATSLGDNGYLDLSGFYRKHQHSYNAGLDSRVTTPDGTLLSTLTPAQKAAYVTVADYPYVGRSAFGDPETELITGSYNAGYDFGGVELYSFGTYSHRNAEAAQGAQLPDTAIASPVLGVRGVFGAPGTLVYYPNGTVPKWLSREDDLSVTVGLKGGGGGWKWDLSSTYGQNTVNIYSKDTANRSLFVDTHFSPSSFYIGLNKSTEWTNNLDISKEVNLGLFAPLNVAFGAEYRRNTYQVGAGDPASYYKDGSLSPPGLTPFDANKSSRSNVAGYLDLAFQPVEKLRLDAAVRYEHYSDFGSNVSAKLTGRYDFSPAFALRGTVSTGFRAPTLAEEHYSQTSASSTRVAVTLPANSAAAKLVGFQDLKPEKATNFSFGTVIRPASGLTITIDAYQITIKDRIVTTGNIFGRGGAVNSPAVLDAITARGVSIDPTIGLVSVNALTNGMNTRARGIDITANYRMKTDNAGTFNWVLLANFTQRVINRIDAPPAQIAGQLLFDRRAQGLVTTATPNSKIIGGLDWDLGRLSVSLRETYFGPAYIYNSPNNGNYVRNEVTPSFITDLEIGLDLTKNISFALGANNLFNKKPEGVKIDPVTKQISVGGLTVYNFPLTNSPYGINGGYYYGRITLKW